MFYQMIILVQSTKFWPLLWKKRHWRASFGECIESRCAKAFSTGKYEKLAVKIEKYTEVMLWGKCLRGRLAITDDCWQQTIIPLRDAILISVNNAYHFIIQNTQWLSNDYPIMASTNIFTDKINMLLSL